MTWPTVQLREVAASVDYGLTAPAIFELTGPKFLRITDIQNGAVDWNSVPHCDADASAEIANRLLPGDILFARTGATTGKSYLIRNCPERAVFASYLIRVRATEVVEPRFLARFFETPDYWQQVHLNARGAAQVGINSTVLRGLEIPLPPRPEQLRIAAILDQADDLRRKRRQSLGRFDDLAEAVFLDLFGDPHRNTKGWNDTLSLGEVAEIASGVTIGRNLAGQKTRSAPYLAVINVQDRALNLESVKVTEATEDEIARYRLFPGDLLLTEGGDPDKLGRGTLWHGEIDDCIHQNHVFRVRLTIDSVDPVFLNWLVGSRRGKRYFLRSAKQTTGIATINMRQLRDFPLLVPPLAMQREFRARLEAIAALKATAIAHLARLDALFASLQHRAFRGEL